MGSDREDVRPVEEEEDEDEETELDASGNERDP
jgi:hypothetical protein